MLSRSFRNQLVDFLQLNHLQKAPVFDFLHLNYAHGGIFARCDVRSKDYRSKEELREHVGTVHEGSFAYCDVCIKDYLSKEELRKHVGHAHEGIFAHCGAQ